MEEARQHSALTHEQRAFAAVFFAGHVAFLSGIVAIIAGYGPGIKLGVIGLAFSKIALAVWAMSRPWAQTALASNFSRVFVAVAWAVIAALLIWSWR
jgi:hypothetical protein